jgi:hypothetical protein
VTIYAGCSAVAAGNPAVLGLEIAVRVGRFSMMASCAELVTGKCRTLRLGYDPIERPPALLRSGPKTDKIGSEALMRLFEAFIRCKTTLDDLSNRAAALGEDLSAPVIAAHLTGKSAFQLRSTRSLSLPSTLASPSCHCLRLLPHKAERDLAQLGNRSAAGASSTSLMADWVVVKILIDCACRVSGSSTVSMWCPGGGSRSR